MIISRKDFAEKVAAAGVDRTYHALAKYGLSISTHLVNLLWKNKEIAASTSNEASSPNIDCDRHLECHWFKNMGELSHATVSTERNVVGEKARSLGVAENLPSRSRTVQWRRPLHVRDRKRFTGTVKEPERQHVNERFEGDHPTGDDWRGDVRLSGSLPQRKRMDAIEHQQA